MLKVGMLSKWHVHAEGYADLVQNSSIAKVTAVWDDDEQRGRDWAKKLNCKYYHALEDLLSDPDVEAMVCDAPTTQHYHILKQAAAAGKHIFTEKVLAPSVAECEELADCIEQAGITFTISFPQRTTPVECLAKRLVEEGAFGKISLVRIRKAHNGLSGGWLPKYWFDEKDTAGGALMDLGCHPMYLSTWLLGKPVRLSALLNTSMGGNMDEAATVSIEFENGAVCTGETSFVSFRSPDSLEIYGTDATLYAVGNDVKLYTKTAAENPIIPELPEEKPLPLLQFLQACQNGSGTPKDFCPREAVKLTRLLENAYLSNRENRTVKL